MGEGVEMGVGVGVGIVVGVDVGVEVRVRIVFSRKHLVRTVCFTVGVRGGYDAPVIVEAGGVIKSNVESITQLATKNLTNANQAADSAHNLAVMGAQLMDAAKKISV